MGLGLYGGADFDMGYRNRDAYEGLGSPGNQEARMYLRHAFAAMGLEASLQGTHLNVVGELIGTTTPEKIYIIGGHYDHLEGDRPGGDDNASGTAGVLEAARVLSQHRFESTIRFIGFNAEEDTRAGSNDYVNNHVIPANENIVGMINLDMILRPGSDVDPNSVIDAEVEAKADHPPSVAWAEAFLEAADTYVPTLVVNDTIIDTESTSDNDPFRDAGFPAILVIENSLPDFWEANSHYHTYEDASDRLANDPESPSGVTYDYGFATEVTRAVVALIAQEAVPVSGPAGS
jgi:Zn-dependent M28 family amino/carboxypeptidase